MSAIYSAPEMKQWDAFTIQHEPISSLNLMERAAEVCLKQIIGNHLSKSIVVVCGKGNNGGDGLAIARLLADCGKTVSVLICEHTAKGSDDFEQNLKRLPRSVKRHSLQEGTPLNLSADLVVDAIFGTGLTRPITGWMGEIVSEMNSSGIPIIAIDIPSGLFATDNRKNPLTHCIQAIETLTFQQPKMCFFYAEYLPFTGKVKTLDIGLSSEFNGKREATLIGKSECRLTPNSIFSHKGNKGYLTVIAGNPTMLGSAILASKAGFKTGCGYVGVIGPAALTIPLAIQLPEGIWLGETWQKVSTKTSGLAIGPGIGKTEKALHILNSALGSGIPLVIDADALNLIGEHPNLWNQLPKDAILTPHLAELNRLIGETSSPEERLQRQLEYSINYQIYIVQKGAFTKMTCPDGRVFINSSGNEAMATAGMGDALTGMIGSFLAQGYSAAESAINGIFYHGKAGDIAIEQQGKYGLLTSDLINTIPAALNSY